MSDDTLLIKVNLLREDNLELRHDIARHVQICADQANEIAELRQQLDRYTRISESGESLGDALDMAEELESLRKQLEQAEARCKKLWDEIARIHGATSPASSE